MTELAERFDDAHITFHVKDSTAREYRRAIQLYILPAFGTMYVAEVNVQLGDAPLDVIRSIKRVEDNPWLLTGKVEGGRPIDLQPFWQRVRARAGLNDARIHDLRHTFASIAVADGVPLYSVGKLFGHASTQTTARYADLGEGTMRVAADRVSSLIAGRMRSPAIDHAAVEQLSTPLC